MCFSMINKTNSNVRSEKKERNNLKRMRINMHLEEGKKEKGKEKTMIKQINKKKKKYNEMKCIPVETRD